jgi:hypothetical protein
MTEFPSFLVIICPCIYTGVEQEEQEARALQQASLSRQEELRACEQRAIAFKEQVATAEQECISLEDCEYDKTLCACTLDSMHAFCRCSVYHVIAYFSQRSDYSCLVFQCTAANLDEGIKQKRLGALRKALSIYSSRLGLEFKQGTGACENYIETTYLCKACKLPHLPFVCRGA